MTVSDPATRQTYQDGLVRGLQDARAVADGREPRGPGRPPGYPNGSYHLGYQAGLNAAVTPVQRASSATRPPVSVPWRAPRADNAGRQRRQPGPWQIREMT